MGNTRELGERKEGQKKWGGEFNTAQRNKGFLFSHSQDDHHNDGYPSKQSHSITNFSFMHRVRLIKNKRFQMAVISEKMKTGD